MATLSRMVKKAASSVIPLANSTIHPRNYSSAIFTTLLKNSTTSISTNLFRQLFQRTSIPTHHHFSALAKKRSNSDKALLRIIESETYWAEEELDNLEVEAPRDFPFKIEYYNNARIRTLTLARDYQGEEIKVEVQQPRDCGQYVDLVATVLAKGKLTLKFKVRAEADEITINTLAIQIPKNVTFEVPTFVEVKAEADGSSLAVKIPNASDGDIVYEGLVSNYVYLTARYLAENQQLAAIRTYLEVRGIKTSNTKFLHDYMVSKELTDYIGWMKQIKNFIAMKNF